MNGRRLAIVGLLGCLGFSIVLIFAPNAEANCPGAHISISAVKGERGSMLTVTGRYFSPVCDDVGSGPRPRPPAKKIKILLKQGKKSILLTTVDADSNLSFSVTVTIPANAVSGSATIIADMRTKTTKPIAFEVGESGQQNKN
jgi:hypothetical protein